MAAHSWDIAFYSEKSSSPLLIIPSRSRAALTTHSSWQVPVTANKNQRQPRMEKLNTKVSELQSFFISCYQWTDLHARVLNLLRGWERRTSPISWAVKPQSPGDARMLLQVSPTLLLRSSQPPRQHRDNSYLLHFHSVVPKSTNALPVAKASKGHNFWKPSSQTPAQTSCRLPDSVLQNNRQQSQQGKIPSELLLSLLHA